MNKPMTTAEAEERFGCDHPHEMGCDCLLSATCSYFCPACNGHIWFPGWVRNHGNPETCNCPYCGAHTINPHPEIKERP